MKIVANEAETHFSFKDLFSCLKLEMGFCFKRKEMYEKTK